MPDGRPGPTLAGMVAPTAGSTALFLAECFAPSAAEDVSIRVADGIGAACADLRAEETDIAYLGALVVPDDETAFHLFIAADAGVVLEATRRATLRVERVVRSVAIGVDERLVPVSVEPDRALAHSPGEIRP